MDISRLGACLSLWGHNLATGQILDPIIPLQAMPELAQGLLMTIKLISVSLLLGICLAVPLALCRVSANPFLKWPVYAYTYFFRGTPLLIQIFLIYYGSGQFAWIKDTWLWTYVFIDPWWPSVIAFTLNTAAYTTEILRGAIQAVPLGEIEAARALGMSKGLIYRRIVLPRAFRLMLPAYSNEVIFTLQASSIASVVTLQELTKVTQIAIARTFGIFELYLTIAAIYLCLTYAIVWAFRVWEHRWSAHLRERPAEPQIGLVVQH
ncbi:MAG TPA: ABC transporter permease [Dongiaceae bacterium]|jgi:His/Glu/Gln/Arg/opine family amino acid ABC transporter permease subunit|nr:ABC transporter permease [Dongiaceae bacterium]